jgi:hypothetical protein
VVIEMEGGKEANSEDTGGEGEYWEVGGEINSEEEGGRGACILARKKEKVNNEDKKWKR